MLGERLDDRLLGARGFFENIVRFVPQDAARLARRACTVAELMVANMMAANMLLVCITFVWVLTYVYRYIA